MNESVSHKKHRSHRKDGDRKMSDRKMKKEGDKKMRDRKMRKKM